MEAIVVPGHGDITDVDALHHQRRYFDDVRNFVSVQIKREHSREDIVAMQIPGYEDYGFARIQNRCLAAVYDELTRD